LYHSPLVNDVSTAHDCALDVVVTLYILKLLHPHLLGHDFRYVLALAVAVSVHVLYAFGSTLQLPLLHVDVVAAHVVDVLVHSTELAAYVVHVSP